MQGVVSQADVSVPQAESWSGVVADLVPVFAARAARSDDEDAFVSENYVLLRSSGLVAAGVPAELGGSGATHAELCEMLRRMAHACPATALAFSMHTHQVALAAWRWRNQKAPLEPLLRRVAAERIVILSSGGADWLAGSGTAERVEGGYRITARKGFASGAPAADLFMTSAIAEDEPGRREVLHFAVPMNAAGVRIEHTWKTLGMRGTGSHDVVLDGVFVPDAAISARRTPGVWHPLFHMISMIALPIIYSVYLGVAQALRDRALEMARRRSHAGIVERVGALQNEVRSAELAHADMVAAAASGSPGFETTNRVATARALLVRSVIEAADLAFDVAGGGAFYRDRGFERLFRDVQGARFHPLQDGDQRHLSAALALGLDPNP